MQNNIAAGAARRPVKVVPKAEKKYQQGLALMQQGRWEEAARAFEAAIERLPRDPLFWLNLAQARRKQGDAAAAERAARRALELDPRAELARRMLADVLAMQGRPAQAAELLRAPSRSAGGSSEIFLEAGLALLQAEQPRAREAAEKFMEALRRQPDCVPAHMGLGDAFTRLGAPLLAAECFRTVVTLDPGHVYAWSALVHQSMHACHWKQLDADIRALAAAQAAHPDQQPVGFTHLSIPGTTAAEHRRSAAAFARVHIGTPQPLPAVLPAARRPGRIRVGYLSSDFHEHATSYLLAQALELHDRNRFEIFLYSYGPDDRSPMRRRIGAAAEHFVDLREAAALAMARRIHADGIDILVDLKGYTYGSRPGVLGYRAAPIQVNFLGYPGTLGTPLVDYLVTDPIVTPAEAANDYAEKFAFLPDCYQPNDRTRPIGPPFTRADCGLPERGFVFCCFNNTYKITPAMFDIWCRLLVSVEGSVLWLLDANLQAKDNLRAEAGARGVDPQRLIFAPKLPLAQHLARLANADLVLDTLPYNAHTTASDALWVGVPLLTCPGETFASRVAASLLTAAGLPELIVPSLEQYQALALRLAREPQTMAALRAKLRESRDRCALFDTPRYVRNLEALYEQMFERWRAGQPAQTLTASVAHEPGAQATTVCAPPRVDRRPRVLLIDPGLFGRGGHNAALAEEFATALSGRATLCIASARDFDPTRTGWQAQVVPAFRINGYARFEARQLADRALMSELRRQIDEDVSALQPDTFDLWLMPTAYPLHLEALARRAARSHGASVTVGLLIPPSFWADDSPAAARIADLMREAIDRLRGCAGARIYSETGTYDLGSERLRLPVMLPPVSAATRAQIARLAARPACAGRTIRYGFFGSPFTSKGIEHLVAAARTGIAENARLVFRLPEGFAPLCAELNRQSPQVEATSALMTNAQYLEAMADVDVVLAAYDPAHYARKMSGIVPEALALGKPVLMADGCDALHAFADRFAPGACQSVGYSAEAIRRAVAQPASHWQRLAACARASAPVIQALKDMDRYLAVAGIQAAANDTHEAACP